MLEVQKWLKENNNDFDKLKEEFGIKFKLYNDRVVLNYLQIESRKLDPIVKECRGLILSFPNTNVILSISFDRFFNYSEDPLTDSFNIQKATIYEKCDGSLINLFFDGKEIQIATRGLAFAEGKTPHGPTYKELVLRTSPYLIHSIQKKIKPEFIRDHTLIFELCTAENRIVKQYNKDRLFLLAIRNKNTGDYIHDWEVDKIAQNISVDRPEEIYLNSWDSITKNISLLPVLDEGYVCNHNGWRIKIKSPSYVAIHHLRENGVISPKRISVLIFLEETDEYITYFPEDEIFFKPYKEAYEEFRENLNYIWICVKDIKDQKEFAMEVKDLPISFFLFQFRKGFSYEDVLKNMTDNKKLELLEYYRGKENE